MKKTRIACVSSCICGIVTAKMFGAALTKTIEKRSNIELLGAEYQGGMGISNELTQAQIDAADVIILSMDSTIQKMDRFKDKLCVTCACHEALKDPDKILDLAIEKFKTTKRR